MSNNNNMRSHTQPSRPRIHASDGKLLRRASLVGIVKRLTMKTEMPKLNTTGKWKLRAALKKANSRAALHNQIRSDLEIKALLACIPMAPQLPAPSHKEALEEALFHGWTVNGSTYARSIRSGHYSSSIQAALNECRRLSNLDGAFCINPDDLLLSILCRSSRSKITSECKSVLSSMLLSSSELYLNHEIETNNNNAHPVEMDIVSGGPGGTGCIYFVLQYVLPFQLLRVTEDNAFGSSSSHSSIASSDRSSNSNISVDDSSVVLYEENSFSENELLVFHAVVSDCFAVFGHGRIESFRKMKVMLLEDDKTKLMRWVS